MQPFPDLYNQKTRHLWRQQRLSHRPLGKHTRAIEEVAARKDLNIVVIMTDDTGPSGFGLLTCWSEPGRAGRYRQWRPAQTPMASVTNLHSSPPGNSITGFFSVIPMCNFFGRHFSVTLNAIRF